MISQSLKNSNQHSQPKAPVLSELCGALCSADAKWVSNQMVAQNKIVLSREREDTDLEEYVVRRLTCEECEVLQNYPRGYSNIGEWTDTKGKKHKPADSPRYKALGNSVCAMENSYWEFVLQGILEELGGKGTMGSFFDGIGGFPMTWNALNNDDGATLWASEIEEFPIAVTKIRIPKMQHLGDITKLNGAEMPLVNVTCGGSPCQDLSVAGKRQSFYNEDGTLTRSGLFLCQIERIKEMRNYAQRVRGADNNVCRFHVWENVPGAFSSNKGEDFRTVLECFCKIADPDIVIPQPPKGKWSPHGAIVGDGFSVAWSTHCSSQWCAPQRRKRICVVADIGGQSAPKILFERESSTWHSVKGKSQRKETPRTVGEGTSVSGGTFFVNPDLVEDGDVEDASTPLRGGRHTELTLPLQGMSEAFS